jgi:hypothetical protein
MHKRRHQRTQPQHQTYRSTYFHFAFAKRGGLIHVVGMTAEGQNSMGWLHDIGHVSLFLLHYETTLSFWGMAKSADFTSLPASATQMLQPGNNASSTLVATY